MDKDLALTSEQLAIMTPDELLAYLDTTWPWPMSQVQEWFEQFYNAVLSWIHQAVGWIYDRIKPLIDNVWSWLQSAISSITFNISLLINQVWSWLQSIATSIVSQVSSLFSQVWTWINQGVASIVNTIQGFTSQVWSWLQSAISSINQLISAQINSLYITLHQFASTIQERVSAINEWFSNEFIDPFLDWLIQFPGKLYEGFRNFFVDQWQLIWGFWSKDWNWLKLLTGMVVAFGGGAIVLSAPAIGAALITAARWLGGILLTLGPAIGGWFASVFGELGIWIELYAGAFGSWLIRLLPRMLTWLGKNWLPLFTSSLVLGMGVTGNLNDLIAKFITPKIQDVMSWAEKMGPVSPESGLGATKSITNLITFTISGLASMTLMGEALSPLKHLGMGHISAMLYDLINYKTLTAAFMGVLAFVYIKTPLTYYYQKIARPNIPDERQLLGLAGEYAITKSEFKEIMQWHGYPDTWIDKLYELADRPMTAYMFRNLAEAGILDAELLDRELKNAGYNEKTIPYLKLMFQRLAATSLQAVAVSSAMTRYKEGLDNQNNLQQNLTVLGISPELMPRYLYAADLQYTTDYSLDLISYYKDAYHRREIEEAEFRQGLVSAGLLPERINPIVAREATKRLAAPKAVDLPEFAVQFDTIRDRRKKLLITRDAEVQQLVSIGKELPYAIAIADNDDVALAIKAEVITPKAIPVYETEEGKVRADSIRRLHRARQSTPEEELAALLELEMPVGLAKAIVENDELRLRKETASE